MLCHHSVGGARSAARVRFYKHEDNQARNSKVSTPASHSGRRGSAAGRRWCSAAAARAQRGRVRTLPGPAAAARPASPARQPVRSSACLSGLLVNRPCSEHFAGLRECENAWSSRCNPTALWWCPDGPPLRSALPQRRQRPHWLRPGRGHARYCRSETLQSCLSWPLPCPRRAARFATLAARMTPGAWAHCCCCRLAPP